MALLLGLLATACAGPSGAASGHRVIVRLYDAEYGTHLELANETHPELRDAYSQRKADASLKLVPDELMADLVASIEQVHFDTLSTPGAPPDRAEAADRGLRGWVALDQDGDERTFLIPLDQATSEQLQAYFRMKLVINHFYGGVSGLQYIQNPQGHRIFESGP
jgi:hypothetical protein